MQARLPQYNPGVIPLDRNGVGIARGDLSAYGIKSLGEPGSAGIIPRFWTLAVHQPAESARQGRPIYKDVEVVTILMPGSRNAAPTVRVTEEHRERFPQAYAAFKAKEDYMLEGTALSGWPQVTSSQVAELAAFNVHTVEALAALSDSQAQNFGMGGEALRTRAKAFLDAAAGGAAAAQMAAERDAALARAELQDRQMADMMAQMQALTARLNVAQGLAAPVPAPAAEGYVPSLLTAEQQEAAKPRGRPRTTNL